MPDGGAPQWRSVGPSRGGRCVAVAGDPGDPATFWFGACAGGVWKTTDAGQYWLPVSDGQLGTSSIGAIAVAPSDPQVVWAGTGEGCVRNDVVPGDGVYRTTDGGRTWRHLGLEATRHIPRIRVHPADPDTAWVAALGDIFGTNPERGIFKTTDGGRSWRHILSVSDRAGAADLALDAVNPRILYAAIWQAVRQPWDMSSGGEDSGLWRSLDGGETWEPLAAGPGFPGGLLGRIGVAVSPARPERLWAVVEAEAGGVYRSDDRGDTWELVSDRGGVRGRPWYYSHLTADPSDAETVWSMNLWAWRSTDGGRSWTQVQTPHGDNHDLWIDPANPRRMINGNDGGACVSFNGGFSWSSIYNQPTAQLYRFDVDPRFPHDLFATQQDNSGIRVPSRSWKGAIRWPDCQELGEAESGDVALDPLDPRFVFLGGAGFGHPGPLLRFDRVTEQAQDIAVWPEYFLGTRATEHRHRFGWTYPIAFSPHDPSALYIGGERLFRSRDRGRTWEELSPDLTRDDPERQRLSGGPISNDTSGAEVYCTVHSFAESPLVPGEFWVGTDDGLVHRSPDGGATWDDVTPAELPEWATVQRVEPSRHEPGTAYLAAHAYRLQDRRPLLFRTRDAGRSWSRIVAGIPDGEWTRAVCEDPELPGVLYAGTERRVWMSRDAGDSWFPISANLPSVPVYDLKIRGAELIAATHGRGFWILDDVTPLRADPGPDDDVVLFGPPPVVRYPTPNGFDMPGEGVWVGGFPGVPLGGAAFTPVKQPDGTVRNVVIDGGTNPPDGVALWYRLPSAEGPVRLAVLDGPAVLREFSSDPPDDGPEVDERDRLPVRAGLNRFVWDLRIAGPVGAPGDDGRRPVLTPGPRVPPGTYTLELTVGDTTRRTEVHVSRDPRLDTTDEDLHEQYRYLVRVRDLLAALSEGLMRIRRVRDQLAGWRGRVPSPLAEQVERLGERLGAVERVLTQPGISDHGDALKLPAGLDQKLVLLPEIVVELSDTRPTRGAEEVLRMLGAATTEALDDLDRLLGPELAELEAALRAAGVPLIDVPQVPL